MEGVHENNVVLYEWFKEFLSMNELHMHVLLSFSIEIVMNTLNLILKRESTFCTTLL